MVCLFTSQLSQLLNYSILLGEQWTATRVNNLARVVHNITTSWGEPDVLTFVQPRHTVIHITSVDLSELLVPNYNVVIACLQQIREQNTPSSINSICFKSYTTHSFRCAAKCRKNVRLHRKIIDPPGMESFSYTNDSFSWVAITDCEWNSLSCSVHMVYVKQLAQLWQRDRATLASFSINVQLYSQNHKLHFWATLWGIKDYISALS